jgi:hypothetical protein
MEQGVGMANRENVGNGELNEDDAGTAAHLDQVSLKYGGQDLPLAKSEELIAVKPRPESRSMLSELIPQVGRTEAPASSLGGFELINVSDAELPMEESLDALSANPAIAVGTHVFHTSDDKMPFVPTGQIYVEFSPDAARRFVLSTRASRAIERCASEGRSGLGTVVCFAAGNDNRDIHDPASEIGRAHV